jgi:hypothetical protein
MGTAFADAFVGYMSQNSTAGGVANTLSSADRLNGGAGADSLFAELVPEFFGATGNNQIDMQPRTTSIETIEFEARDLGLNSGGSDDGVDDATVPTRDRVLHPGPAVKKHQCKC